ncbi:unnamed protein product [Effrenium voratum]|uniref:RING-type domain-containing protein n=1 Tax=Effrenium voratum TaxID=2562239 RepID=A0AA36NE16_9DINO|nr:unnamed protein product [Effrenium voratum]
MVMAMLCCMAGLLTLVLAVLVVCFLLDTTLSWKHKATYYACRRKVQRVQEALMKGKEDLALCPCCVECTSTTQSQKKVKFICGHGYHLHCVNRWFHENPNSVGCPVCVGQPEELREPKARRGRVWRDGSGNVIARETRPKPSSCTAFTDDTPLSLPRSASTAGKGAMRSCGSQSSLALGIAPFSTSSSGPSENDDAGPPVRLRKPACLSDRVGSHLSTTLAPHASAFLASSEARMPTMRNALTSRLYLAGFFDGLGAVHSSAKGCALEITARDRQVERAHISTRGGHDTAVLDLFLRLYGGCLRSTEGPKGTAALKWSISGPEAQRAAVALLAAAQAKRGQLFSVAYWPQGAHGMQGMHATRWMHWMRPAISWPYLAGLLDAVGYIRPPLLVEVPGSAEVLELLHDFLSSASYASSLRRFRRSRLLVDGAVLRELPRFRPTSDAKSFDFDSMRNEATGAVHVLPRERSFQRLQDFWARQEETQRIRGLLELGLHDTDSD